MPRTETENHAVICLGSNTADADSRINAALETVSRLGDVEKCTPVYESEPEYAGENVPYRNQILWLRTALSYEALVGETHVYQTSVRALAHEEPLVAIDLDIVEWNGEIMRPKDAASGYYRKGLSLVKS